MLLLFHSEFFFSLLDQKAKQILQFSDGKALGNFDGNLLIASGRYVYAIKQISVKLQVEVSLMMNLRHPRSDI